MAQENLQWYALQTRSRHEKVVAEELWQKKIECFLPLVERKSQWKDRKKLVQFPVFPGYLFVHADIRKNRLDILEVRSVVRLVGFANKPEPIPEHQIQAVREMVFNQMEIDPYPYISAGRRMRIVRGPLRGLEGILIEKTKRFSFVISIDLIQQSVACQIDASDVEPVT